jgi:hypothetical protein
MAINILSAMFHIAGITNVFTVRNNIFYSALVILLPVATKKYNVIQT